MMCSGIDQVCAQSGMDVVLNDINEEAIGKDLKNITWSLSMFIEKGRLAEDKDTILNRISIDTDYSKADYVDLPIEAVYEKLDLKKKAVFYRFDEACQENALFASNTRLSLFLN